MSIVLFSLLAAVLPPDVDAALLSGIEKRPAAELQYAGLAALYPGRVLGAEPNKNDLLNNGRSPKEGALPRHLAYLRVYDLEASLPKISEMLGQPALILDLRYVTANASAAENFAATLAKAGLGSAPVRAVGNMPQPAKLPEAEPVPTKAKPAPLLLVLVNGQTSGPLEAWLAAFQEKEGLYAVGSPTAGQPGIYRKAEGAEGYYVMTGELQPASGSVAGTGVKPRFAVDVTPQQNYEAYLSFENGVNLANLLRNEAPAASATAAASGNATNSGSPAAVRAAANANEEATDPVLQRAVDVVAALQVLGRMPSSTPPDAGKMPVAQPASASPANPVNQR